MLALEVIKPLLDAFISGEGWSCLLKTSIGKSSKPFSCKMCCKGFVTQANLNTHMEKYHKSFQFTSVVDNLKTNDNSSRTHEEESTKMEIDEEVVEKCHGKGKKNNEEMEEDEIVAQSKLRDRQILEKRKKNEEKEKMLEIQKLEKEKKRKEEEEQKAAEKARVNKMKKKKSIKLKKKGKEYPPNVTELPSNIKHLVNDATNRSF